MTREHFLKGVENWNNHLYCLWPALGATSGNVVEFGCGHGSTAQLHEYCADKKRNLKSYDFNQEWIDKFKHFETDSHKFEHAPNWDLVNLKDVDVLLIDHSPGERRWEDIKKYANIAKIIVIHDSEPAATGYMLDKIWGLFKYRNDHKTIGAWATVASNFIDVSKFEV